MSGSGGSGSCRSMSEDTDNDSVILAKRNPSTQSVPKKRKKPSRSSSNDSDTQSVPRASDAEGNDAKRPSKPRPKKQGKPQLSHEKVEEIADVTMEEEAPTNKLHALRAKSEKIFKSLLAYVTAPENGIKSSASCYITSKFNKLQGVLSDVLIMNSNLEGQLHASMSENRDQRKSFEIATGKSSVPKTSQKALTYAERVGVKSRTAARSNLKQDPPNVLTILPIDTKAFDSSEKTKETVFNLVSPRKDKIQVKNVRRIQGNGILVETANKMDLSTLLSNNKLKAAGLVVAAPVKRSPRIIVYEVPRMDSDEATLDAIVDQNVDDDSKAKVRRQMKLAFRTGDRNRDACNVILEVSKEVRALLVGKERLYIGWGCCKVHDYVAATRCYKCHGFGHTSKHCKSEHEICGYCAAPGHSFKNCPSKSEFAACINCKKSSRPHYHSVTSRNCPAYVSAINNILSRTDYGV